MGQKGVPWPQLCIGLHKIICAVGRAFNKKSKIKWVPAIGFCWCTYYYNGHISLCEPFFNDIHLDEPVEHRVLLPTPEISSQAVV